MQKNQILIDKDNMKIFANQLEKEKLDLKTVRLRLKEARDSSLVLTRKMEASNKKIQKINARNITELTESKTKILKTISRLERQLGKMKEKVEHVGKEKKSIDDSVHGVRNNLIEEIKMLKAEEEAIIIERNTFKQKADYLQSELDKQIRDSKKKSNSLFTSRRNSTPQISFSTREPLQEEVQKLKKSKKDMEDALEVFKRAYEQQRNITRQEHQTSIFLRDKNKSKSTSQSAELQSLRILVNSLSEEISDKQLEIQQVRKANKILGNRMRELEKKTIHLVPS